MSVSSVLSQTPAAEWHRMFKRLRGKIRGVMYRHYMHSGAWRSKRSMVILAARGKCGVCRENDATQVHHKSYADLGDERPHQLQAVCDLCHQRTHEWGIERELA